MSVLVMICESRATFLVSEPLKAITNPSTAASLCLRSILHHGRLQPLGVLDVDGLHVAVQLLLGALLVVALARYPHAQPERHALHAGLPDLLVQLRVETDVAGALYVDIVVSSGSQPVGVVLRAREE